MRNAAKRNDAIRDRRGSREGSAAPLSPVGETRRGTGRNPAPSVMDARTVLQEASAGRRARVADKLRTSPIFEAGIRRTIRTLHPRERELVTMETAKSRLDKARKAFAQTLRARKLRAAKAPATKVIAMKTSVAKALATTATAVKAIAMRPNAARVPATKPLAPTIVGRTGTGGAKASEASRAIAPKAAPARIRELPNQTISPATSKYISKRRVSPR